MDAGKSKGKTRRARGRIGTRFDEYLKEEGLHETTRSLAIKRVLAWQIAEAMKAARLTKAEMAKRMKTSRSQLDRLLDPDNDDVTLTTLARAARAVGREISLELV